MKINLKPIWGVVILYVLVVCFRCWNG